MPEIRIDELSEIIKKQIESFEGIGVEKQDIGTVLQVGDNVILAYGLRGVKYGEIIDLGNDRYGLAFDLQEESVGILLLGN
ncbi:MAG: F0F1 ATP synthase subunit alpha, partial [bacterium]